MNPDDPKISPTTKSFDEPIIAFEDPFFEPKPQITQKPRTIDKSTTIRKKPRINTSKTSGK